jgi:predicted ATP-grasp superfamily ATP-dependent carboligase
MLNALEMRNAAAYALLSYSNTERIDPRAAATAVQFIAKRYNLQIDTLPLIKGAEELEREMSTVAEQERERERTSRSAIYS